MIEVEAAKTPGQREQIEERLIEKSAIYLDVWKFGVNTALRIGGILAIRMDDVRKLDEDHSALELIEAKTKRTGKRRTVTLNQGALEVITRRLALNPDDEWLFQSTSPRHSRRHGPQPLTRKAVGRVFEAVGQNVRPKVRLGTHSMRKTRGFAMHEAGEQIETICRMFGHSHPAITMRYIGLDSQTVRQGYEGLVL